MNRQVLEGNPKSPSMSRRNLLRASIGLCVLGAGAAITDRFVPLSDLTADKFTLTGQDATMHLDDGTVLTLGPRSAIDYDITATKRTISLLTGDLMIKSAVVSGYPLVLKTSEITSRSDGGHFVIRFRNDRQTLTAIDTPASVSAVSGHDFRLGVEESLVIAENRFEIRKADLPRETAWADGLLIVRDHPLDDIIDGIRPYFAGVVVVNSNVGRRRVTGVFPLKSPADTIAQVGRILDLDVNWRTRYWVSLDDPNHASS